MSNTTIQLRHSTESGNVPVSLANGEIAINTQDGKLFYADPSGIVKEFSGFPGPSGLDTEIQFNDSGVLGANSRLTFNKTTGTLTVNGSVVANVFNDDGVNVYEHAEQAYIHANAAFDAANTSVGGNSFGVIFTSNNSTFANAITSNDQITFTGVNGVSVEANGTTKVITFAGTPGAQGLTVDYGLVTESIVFSLDYGTL
jgi:hypothetical protein